MTADLPVLLVSPDRRLVAAVRSFLGDVGLSVLRVDPAGPVPDGSWQAALVDLRTLEPAAADAEVARFAARSPVVVLMADPARVRSLVEDLGVVDFATAAEPEQAVALRLWRAAVASHLRLPPGIRRLVRHDVRSPLAVILGQCELLMIETGGALSERQRKSVDAIERQAKNLRTLLDELGDRLAPFISDRADAAEG